jgi:CheY-like chemotaxis protein
VSKHKLLLADDSITIQKVVNLTFADEGIEVISVGDGNSAMAKFEEFTPDLVMADINMPGLSGYEICERIKGNEATRRIPVILLVGSFEPFDEQEAQRVGANDYLTKPFQSIRQLVSKVSDLLNSPSGDEEPEAPVSSFDDTLRMDEDDAPEQFGDAGMDDEMIQASPYSNFQFDETRKYKSQPDADFEDYGKTQPLSTEGLAEINSYQTQETKGFSDSDSNDFDGREENRENELAADESETKEFSADENEFSSQAREYESTPIGGRSPILDLDDMDLLELPPRRIFPVAAPSQPAFQDNFVPPAVETVETTPEETTETVKAQENEPASDASPTANLSPEIIDAIAAKVVEKISDKVIREIAWEVVPQMTDLIVKRMAEEKLKE